MTDAAVVEAQIERLAVGLARREFADYVAYVHVDEVKRFGGRMPRHLASWAEQLQRRDVRRKGIVAPPASWKSSLVRWLMEYALGRDVEERFLYVMAVSWQATRQVMAMKATMRGPRYRVVFPQVRLDETRPQTQDTIYLVRGSNHPDPSVFATGWNGPYQGMHPTKIITDDLTNQADVRSEMVMADQRARLRGVLLDRNPDGDWWAIFTRWGEADLYRDFEALGFTMLQQPVEGRYPWGRLLAPELFDDEWVRVNRKEKGSALFALTYMCDAAAASGSMVKREWWRYLSEVPKGEDGKPVPVACHSWDFSEGKDNQGDPTVFGAWHRFTEGYMLTDVKREYLDFPAAVKRVLTLYERDVPREVLIEEKSSGTPIIQYLRQHHPRLPVVAEKPGTRDKVARLQGVLPIIEGGRVWLLAGQPWEAGYVDEMAAFPGGAHDDQVDMTSQAIEHMERSGGWKRGSGRAVFTRG